jgi:hypothetical protein
MLDVFTEQNEVLIKDGIANLYWFRADLQKAWLRAGVPEQLCKEISDLKDAEDRALSKRKQMDNLYLRLRTGDFNLRLRISREFVRTLVEHKNFVPQDPKHRIDIAERAALKIREEITSQGSARDKIESAKRAAAKAKIPSYDQELAAVRDLFQTSQQLEPRPRGYALEKIFNTLMRISKVPVESPFSLKGEQLDGAIKYDSSYYILEMKWVAGKAEPKDIGTFYFKVEGRMGARGIFIAMNGFSDGVLETLPRGKELKVLLLDGVHLANVIYGIYTFQQLMDHAIRCATLEGKLYCPHKVVDSPISTA